MPISEWWVKSQLTRLIKNVSKVRMVNSGSIPLRTTKYNNMSKIKDNYLAEIIILIVITIMFITN